MAAALMRAIFCPEYPAKPMGESLRIAKGLDSTSVVVRSSGVRGG